MKGALEVGDIILLDNGSKLILDIWKEDHWVLKLKEKLWVLKLLSLTSGVIEEVDVEEDLMRNYPLRLIIKGTKV
jgi:hypothetical protein